MTPSEIVALSELRAALVMAVGKLDQMVKLQDDLAPAPVIAHQPGLADAPAFFNVLRKTTVLGPVLTVGEVGGCEAILKACVGWPVSWTSYGLATAYHETGHTMQPIHEYGSNAYLSKYDTGELARRLGNTPAADGDGQKFAGRGFVQCTGLANYTKATNELRKRGILKPTESLVDTPDLALRPDVAAAIMRCGMEEGWFTGKKLSTYLAATGDVKQFMAARRIINGDDDAALIAGYAMTFQKALIEGGWAV